MQKTKVEKIIQIFDDEIAYLAREGHELALGGYVQAAMRFSSKLTTANLLRKKILKEIQNED
jgi:hypothetical protein